MSASVFEVFVPNDRWPTFAQINAALAKRDYPVRVVPQDQQDPDSPLAPVQWELRTIVELRNEERNTTLEESSSKQIDEIDAEDINERLEQCGSPFRVSEDMTNFVTSFSVNGPATYAVSAVLLNAVMILDFDGYGFDGEEMKFGRQDYADRMLGWIEADLKPSETPDPPVGNGGGEVPIAARTETQAAPKQAKQGFPLWRTLAVILVILLLAEFVDKNIYNFTGAGA